MRMIFAACVLACAAFLVSPAAAGVHCDDRFGCADTSRAPLPAAASGGRPARHIAGRLVCAVNVNAALAERGIAGTGTARTRDFLAWGRPCGCTRPGAVAVYARGVNRNNGHVAIVADESGAVFNPGRRGWTYLHYRKTPIACRCAA